jgi:TRAP-type uncharacterized transport system fused permease subunit
MRKMQGKSAKAIGALYVGFVGWSLYGAIWPVETYIFRMVHMAFIFGLAFLVYPVRPNAGRWTLWLDLLLALLGVATIAYTFTDMDQFIRCSTLPEPLDLFFGLIAILLLLEISRRIVGNTFTAVVLGFLLYMYFGNYFSVRFEKCEWRFLLSLSVSFFYRPLGKHRSYRIIEGRHSDYCC